MRPPFPRHRFDCWRCSHSATMKLICGSFNVSLKKSVNVTVGVRGPRRAVPMASTVLCIVNKYISHSTDPSSGMWAMRANVSVGILWTMRRKCQSISIHKFRFRTGIAIYRSISHTPIGVIGLPQLPRNMMVISNHDRDIHNVPNGIRNVYKKMRRNE
jgi:hypothetical protein